MALIAFVIWELGQNDPIVDLRLLFERNFGLSNLLMFLLGFVLLGSTVLLPMLVQRLFGYTATVAGLVITPGGMAIILVMPLVGRLVSLHRSPLLIATGLLISRAGPVLYDGFDLQTDYTTLAWARIYQAIGLSLLFIPINTAAYLTVPAAKSSEAAALINVSRNLGGSFGISLVVTFLSRSSQTHQTILVAHATAIDPVYRQVIDGIAARFQAQGDTLAAASNKALGMVYGIIQQQALMQAFIDDFRLLGTIFVVLIPFVFIMKGGIAKRPGQPAH